MFCKSYFRVECLFPPIFWTQCCMARGNLWFVRGDVAFNLKIQLCFFRHLCFFLSGILAGCAKSFSGQKKVFAPRGKFEVFKWVCVDACVYACVWMRVYMCALMCVSMCVYVCMDVCTCVCVCVCLSVCLSVCVCACRLCLCEHCIKLWLCLYYISKSW